MAYLRSHGTPVAINPFGDVTLAGTQTLTNKTLTSPTLTTPALGTPTAVVLTSASGVLPAAVTGGSGITALGTVTSGNISAAAIVKPSGQQVQRIVSQIYQNNHASAHSGQWVGHGKENSIKFNFTPKSTASTMILEYSYGIVHTSTSGGHGAYAFCKNTTRNAWQQATFSDTYGHFMSGSSTTAGFYNATYGTLRDSNHGSTTQFLIKMQINWHTNNWYYGHDGCFHHMSITEYLN